jgi:predicted dehydrogenase
LEDKRLSFLVKERSKMIRMGIIGLGKMGISHHAIINMHPDVKLAAVCDASAYILDVLNKYTGVTCFNDYRKMIDKSALDSMIVATPSRSHGEIVQYALERNLHVFVEKPFSINVEEGRKLAELAEKKNLVNQVGYHFRFIGTFREAKRLLDLGTIGDIYNFRVEAYGPVVLRPQGFTWRSNRSEGGGCLYDYASHAIDLVNYLIGPPSGVGGTVLNKIYSKDVEDEVYATLYYPDGKNGHLAVNWSDETYRKMSTRISIWGNNGKIVADRQEYQVYLRETKNRVGLTKGWNVRNTTGLTEPVWFFLRGEEYSAQLDHFVQCIKNSKTENISSFKSALETDIVIDMLLKDAARGPRSDDFNKEAARVAIRKGIHNRLFWIVLSRWRDYRR